MGSSFSIMGGIEEEFCRPRTLLTIDHHFLQLIPGLLKSLLEMNVYYEFRADRPAS